jgi:hypothetical protein
MSQIDALAEAIKSLHITSCYEGYHDDKSLLRQEITRRYEHANREEMMSREQRFRRRGQNEYEPDPASEPGPVAWGDRILGQRGDDFHLEGEEYGKNTQNAVLNRLLVPHQFQRWKDMNAENETVYGDLFNFKMTDHKLIGEHYDVVAKYVFAKEKFVTEFADSLGRFSQLQSVEFLEPLIEGAKRYESMFHHPSLRARGGGREKNETDHNAFRGLMTGFDLLVRALQRANVYPQTFAIPTPSLNFHCFATSASEEVLRHVLSKTQTLYLNQISERYIISFDRVEGRGLNLRTTTPSHHSEMSLTTRNFPYLRNLTITTRFDMASTASTSPISTWPPKQGTSIVGLDSLTIKLDPLCAANAQLLLKDPGCLNHFAPSLKHLTITNAYHGNWNHFFRSIARSRLESLALVIEPAVYADVQRDAVLLPPHLQFHGIPNLPEVHGCVCVQELFEGAAVRCMVEPHWVFGRVREVWREQERAVERLLEDSEEEGPFDWEDDDDGEGEMEDE